jgi:prophage regulatory protein
MVRITTTTAPAPTLNRIIRRRDLYAFTGLKPTAIDNEIARGSFPKPIPLADKAVGWFESEIIEWQQRRLAERANAEAMERRRERVKPGKRGE